MSKYKPLFVTNTARSGSYLISMMLSTNKDVMVASEPYLELFRALRRALVNNGANAELRSAFDSNAPMQDYYFDPKRIALMDVIQSGEIDVPFDFEEKEWESFVEVSKNRVSLQCKELASRIPDIRGNTYREMFDNALKIVADARQVEDRKWVGIKDAWVIEFFAPLARAYPDAKFIIIVRDPRAVINSHLGGIHKEPEAAASVISYARCWRKHAAFAHHYSNDPLFDGRLFVMTHEEFLRHPEKVSKECCSFLDVEFDAAMLNTNNYHDYSTGTIWKGNSSFEETTSGISLHRAERWKKSLDSKVLKMIEFMCGPEMKLFGFEPIQKNESWPDPEVLNCMLEDNARCKEYCNWRTDFNDPQKDFGYELFRHALLNRGRSDNKDLIRRSFLFKDIFEASL